MIIRVGYVYDTGTHAFLNNAEVVEDIDVQVYVNDAPSVGEGEPGSTIVSAIRLSDRRHFSWVLSEKATLRTVSDVAARFAKG